MDNRVFSSQLSKKQKNRNSIYGRTDQFTTRRKSDLQLINHNVFYTLDR